MPATIGNRLHVGRKHEVVSGSVERNMDFRRCPRDVFLKEGALSVERRPSRVVFVG